MEIEIRAKVKNLDIIKGKLEELGVSLSEQTTQSDFIYKRKGEEKKEQGPGDFILRVRDAEKKKFTFKALTETTGAWEEYETIIDDVDEMKTILEKIGFVNALTMVKKRSCGKLDDLEILSKILGNAVGTKKVWDEYNKIMAAFKSEFDVLLNASHEELIKVTDPHIADMIIKNREGNIEVQPGFDGEYGIPIFKESDRKEYITIVKKQQKSLGDF